MNIEKSRFLAGQVSRWKSYEKGEVRRKQGKEIKKINPGCQ